jgi:hypothetical protein
VGDLFFKLNDSHQLVAWRVPHTALHDMTAKATQHRHSIEGSQHRLFRVTSPRRAEVAS